MGLTQNQLIEIVERSSTVYERANGMFAPKLRNGDATADPVTQTRLERWCQAAAQGDWKTFETRLHWDGFDLAHARRLLIRPTLKDNARLPAWTTTLNELVEAAALYGKTEHARAASTEPFVSTRNPVPFEDLFVPFVCYARQRLVTRSGAADRLLTGPARATLERALLLTLADLWGRTLAAEFALFRAHRSDAFLSVSREADQHGTGLYRDFVHTVLAGKLSELLQEYSVLGRLTTTVVDSWIEANAEFLARLEADRDALAAAFHPEGELGLVTALRANLSDPHENRRFVIALEFASGVKVVYKPRDVRLDSAYHELIEWLNSRGLTPPLRAVRVLGRNGYGWASFVDQSACAGNEDARLYYQRMGALLCIAYVFDGTDLHYENIISSGADPIVVDLETFLYPRVREPESPAGADALGLARDQIRESVLKTGLLPERRVGPDGLGYDVSAIGGKQAQALPGRRPAWEHINTDKMRFRIEAGRSNGSVTVPPAEQYVAELIEGFEDTYKFLVKHREEIVADDGPLALFRDVPVRFIFRATRVYYVLLQNSTHPRFLRDGADRSIALDALSVGFVRAPAVPHTWPILRAEHKALDHLDVPRFVGTTTSGALPTAPDTSIPECFIQPSHASVLARLQLLDGEDMHRQVAFIRGAFLTQASNGHEHHQTDPVAADRAAPPAASETGLLSREDALSEARKIAAVFEALAIRSDDGGATWIGLAYSRSAKQSGVRLLDMALHDGVCGPALFLAALARITGEERYKQLCLAGLQPIQNTLADARAHSRVLKRIGIGGGLGVGSIVYTLTQISQLLDEARLLDDAAGAARMIGEAPLHEDNALDIVLGAAGALLGLLKLYDATGDAAVLQIARTCGEHLLARQTSSGDGRGGWSGLEQRELTGFSHGAAGIAYSLVRLYTVTREPRLLQAVHAALAFERRFFIPDAGNWSRYAGEPADTRRCTWCQGAAGISLARLGIRGSVDAELIQDDLAAGLKTTAEHPVDSIDHLCCGNLGRADILCTAALELRDDILQNRALQIAAQVVTRARRANAYALDEEGTPYRHGFFQGRAGIGYTLLRLTHPNVLPPVLLWS